MLTYAAIDVGAESGRVTVGKLGTGRIELEEVHRFANRPVRLPDGLHWDMPHLFAESLLGLEAAQARAGRLDGVGIDTWAVDYALLDESGRLLGLPFHYRDARTNGILGRAFEGVSAERQYGISGIRPMPFNTSYQLLTEVGSSSLEMAERIALVPDLLAYWLCGELANERTVASSTGLLDARTGGWSPELIGGLGLPSRIFGKLLDPGTVLCPMLEHHGLGPVPVIATAGHDTAAAFAGSAGNSGDTAVLVSGTWSLLGIELPRPLLCEGARAARFSNELGIDGTTRLLTNVMGLWLIQECRRAWAAQGISLSYEELTRQAAAVDEVALFDPDHPELLAPGEMPARLETICAKLGQVLPRDPGAVTRSILTSLACKYRFVVDQLESVLGRAIAQVEVIGGGTRSSFLSRITADLLGRPVAIGRAEASSLGNLLVQARACGALGSFAEMRAVARASAEPVLYEPSAERGHADSLYERFLAVTGLDPAVVAEGAGR